MTTARELRELAKELGLRGYSTAKKADLIKMIEAHDKTDTLVKSVRDKAEAKTPAPAPAPADTDSATETVKKPRAKRGPTAWNSFLNDYRKEHGCTLKEAMAKKDEYSKYKETWKRPEGTEVTQEEA